MAVSRNRWLLVALFMFLATTPASADSLTLDANVFSAAEQMNPNVWKAAIACSPIFFVLDAITTAVTVYFVKRLIWSKKAAKK